MNGMPVNVAIVSGRLSSSPRRTELESGDVLVRYEVTVARDDGPDESVPVAWVGPQRREPAAGDTGDQVVAVGRVRRRWFRLAGGGTASRTEVLATTVLPASRQAAVRKAIAGVVEAMPG